MACIDKNELESFIKGGLPVDKMLEIDEHLQSCAKCRELAINSRAAKDAALGVGGTVVEAFDCPDYDILSDFVDGNIKGDDARALQVHINSCELCARDVEKMASIRAQAIMRKDIRVRPGESGGLMARPTPAWKRVLAGAGAIAAAVVVPVFLYYTMINSEPEADMQAKTDTEEVAPEAKTETAEKPGVATEVVQPEEETVEVAETPAPAEEKTLPVPEVVDAAPGPEAVVSDGKYAVVAKGGKNVLATKSGETVSGRVSQRLASVIEDKLADFKVDGPKPVMMAMADVRVRDAEDFSVAVNAPEIVAPNDRLIESARPKMVWNKVDLAYKYNVMVTDAEGNIVFEEETGKTSVTPNNALPRGEAYAWRVGVKFNQSDSWHYSATARFGVIGEEDYALIEEAKNKLGGSRIALGAAYEAAGLYEEAMEQYRILRRDNSGSEFAGKVLRNTAR